MYKIYKQLSNTQFEIYETNSKDSIVFNGTIDECTEKCLELNTEIFEETRDTKISDLHKAHEKFLEDYKSAYSQPEVESFDDKKKEAIAWNLDNTIATPICDEIALGLGEDREVYLQSVLDKVIYLATQEGKMVAVRDSIKACTTIDEVDAIELPTFPIV